MSCFKLGSIDLQNEWFWSYFKQELWFTTVQKLIPAADL